MAERWALRVLVPLLLGGAGWTHFEIQGLKTRVTVIESTRYTRDDAAVDRLALGETLSRIRESQAVMAEQLNQIAKALEKENR